MEEIKSHLMPYSVYIKTPHASPYFFKIEKDGKQLFYFGSNHTRDKENDQYKQLKEYWEEFISLTRPEDSIVFNEGGLREPFEDLDKSIRQNGEAGFITSLAYPQGYKLFSPEPSRKLDDALIPQYTKEEIQYYYFARMVHQWGNIPERPAFEEYIESVLTHDQTETGWTDFDFSLQNMKRIHTSIFKGEFDEHNINFFYSITNPCFRTTVVNAFSQDQGIERDTHIVGEILEEWSNGKSLFIVYGHTHAVIEEPALKKLT